MKRSALVVALLALALTACGEKAAETAPAPAVVAAPAVVDAAVSAVADTASAVGGAPVVSEVAAPADAMKK